MDEMHLPLVHPDLTLPNSIKLMRDAKRGAVVVDHGSMLVLVRAQDVTRAMNDGVERRVDPASIMIGAVRPQAQPSLPHDLSAGIEQVQPGVSLPYAIRDGLRMLFDEQDRRHFLFRATPTTSRVVTSSERFTASLGGAVTLCWCEGPPPDVHTFTKDQIDVEGQCNYAHRAALKCDDGS